MSRLELAHSSPKSLEVIRPTKVSAGGENGFTVSLHRPFLLDFVLKLSRAMGLHCRETRQPAARGLTESQICIYTAVSFRDDAGDFGQPGLPQYI